MHIDHSQKENRRVNFDPNLIRTSIQLPRQSRLLSTSIKLIRKTSFQPFTDKKKKFGPYVKILQREEIFG